MKYQVILEKCGSNKVAQIAFIRKAYIKDANLNPENAAPEDIAKVDIGLRMAKDLVEAEKPVELGVFVLEATAQYLVENLSNDGSVAICNKIK